MQRRDWQNRVCPAFRREDKGQIIMLPTLPNGRSWWLIGEIKLGYYWKCAVVHGKEKLQAATGEASTRYQKKCFHNKGGQTQTRAQRGADFILGDTQDSTFNLGPKP